MSDLILKDRVAVVTGASRGLGRAIAVSLAGAGARVALVARDIGALDSAAAECGGNARVFPADVSNEGQVATLAAGVLEHFGPASILVNNAGINLRKPLTEFTLEEWNRVIATNLTGVFLMCRAFVPQMRGQSFGRIVNMASTMAHVSIPERTAYSATKSGLLGFTRALALELAPDHITVVAISPGPFATEMNTPFIEDPALNTRFVSKIPLGRWGRSEEVGALVRFICSGEAAFITGTDIVIDGGWCAQ